MMNRHIEVKPEGMQVIWEVSEKPIVEEVRRGWHILFVDGQGIHRFGSILTIDNEHCQFQILDSVAYPNAPGPLGAGGESVPFGRVVMASDGFNWVLKAPVAQVGRRDVAVMGDEEYKGCGGWLDYPQRRWPPLW